MAFFGHCDSRQRCVFRDEGRYFVPVGKKPCSEVRWRLPFSEHRRQPRTRSAAILGSSRDGVSFLSASSRSRLAVLPEYLRALTVVWYHSCASFHCVAGKAYFVNFTVPELHDRRRTQVGYFIKSDWSVSPTPGMGKATNNRTPP